MNTEVCKFISQTDLLRILKFSLTRRSNKPEAENLKLSSWVFSAPRLPEEANVNSFSMNQPLTQSSKNSYQRISEDYEQLTVKNNHKIYKERSYHTRKPTIIIDNKIRPAKSSDVRIIRHRL